MSAHPIHDRASKLFASLYALQARTNESNTQILEKARARLDTVSQRMTSLAPHVLTRRGAEDEYQTLALESRQIKVVIGQCSISW